MGLYFWLIGKQSKALKWWNKATQEGERLCAKPDLARTYWEIGKHLMEPRSKYKQLNGINAKDFLRRAKIMFKDINLQQDLYELENFAFPEKASQV
jgi:hypothetical protein